MKKRQGFSVSSESQAEAIAAILSERDKQDEMWGAQTHDPAYWLAILGKQVGQLGEAVLKYKWADNPTPVDMFDEAAQVAAVATAIMEAIEDERLSDEVTSTRPEPRKLAKVLGRDDESLHAKYDDDECPVAP